MRASYLVLQYKYWTWFAWDKNGEAEWLRGEESQIWTGELDLVNLSWVRPVRLVSCITPPSHHLAPFRDIGLTNYFFLHLLFSIYLDNLWLLKKKMYKIKLNYHPIFSLKLRNRCISGRIRPFERGWCIITFIQSS